MQFATPTTPVEFNVDYPDRQLDRFSTFFRPLFAIPILVVLAVLGGPALGPGRRGGGLFFIGLASGLIASHRCSPSCSARSTHADGSTSTSPSCASTTG